VTKPADAQDSGERPRSQLHDRRVDAAIARAAAAVLEQVFGWRRPGSTKTPRAAQAPARLDVQAIFDELNRK
jgi:hypothetical protein